MKVASLCTGYGGLELALRRAGVDVDLRWYAENDPNVSSVLAAHHPGVPNLGDITALDAYPEPVDLLLAGFPCQTVSIAGKKRGDTDPRWLWPDVFRAVTTLRPPRVLVENVRNLVTFDGGRLFDGITGDLTGAGYAVRYVLLGACHVGAAHHRHRVFLLAEQSDAPTVTRVEVSACGAPRGGAALLPTAQARDGDSRGAGDAAYWAARALRRPNVGMPLDAAVALLPTVTTSEGRGTSDGRRDLRTSLALLPTPRASDGAKGGPNQRGASGDLALPSATQPERFGKFAEAVAGHAALHHAPPEPTEPNRNGAPRLAPRFAEWLMCLPDGHVTSILPREPALKALGNGVVPPQAALAWQLLTAPREESRMSTVDQLVGLTAQRHREQAGRIVDAAGGDVALAHAVLMALADTFTAEAAAISAAKRKGHVGIARDWTDAAVRVRGTAVRIETNAVPLTRAAHEAKLDPTVVELVDTDAADVLAAAGLLDAPVLTTSNGPSFTFTASEGWTLDPPVTVAVDPPAVDYASHYTVTPEGDVITYVDPFTAPAVSADTMIDSPFSSPTPHVERLTWADYSTRSAALPPAAESSYSQVTALAGCGMKYQLGRLARHGGAAPARPGWSLVGGNALHKAIAEVETMAFAGKSTATLDPERLWLYHFEFEIAATHVSSASEPATWHVAGRGKEGYDWWRVEGAAMVGRWLALQSDERRARTRPAKFGTAPAIELEYRMPVDSFGLANGGIISHGFIDNVSVDLGDFSLAIVDYKSGASVPDDTFQLGEYAWALVRVFGVDPVANPISAAYWLARTGEFSTPFNPLERHPWEEVAYRHGAAYRAKDAGAFLPNQSSFCGSCGFVAQCPARGR